MWSLPMTTLFSSRNLYKLIVCIFLMVVMIKIKGQLTTLKSYNVEIATLNEKIATLKEQEQTETVNSVNSRTENEDIARKDLKMYYPNEIPYKGY